MPKQDASGLDRWLSRAKQFFQLVLFLTLIVLIINNWNSVNICVNRFLHSATQVSIANVLTVSVTRLGEGTREESWAAFYRVADRVKILEASLDDNETGFEYLDLIAITPINLGGSYIGDANEMMFLGEKNIHLEAGQTLRIYTYADEKRKGKEKSPKIAEEKLKRQVVIAKRIVKKKKEKDEKGIFKAHIGEGDRIVLIDREKRVILDLDYWWVK